MRIDHKAITSGAAALDQAERTEADKKTGKVSGGAQGGSDSVQLSSDAQLLHRALKAAAEAPETRTDRVDAARAKLAAGEIGRDAGRLADRLIDALVER